MVGDLNPIVPSENILLLHNDSVMQCLSRRQRAWMLEWLEVPEGTSGIWPLVSHTSAPRYHNTLTELLADRNFGFLTTAQRGFLETLNLAFENQEPPLYAQAVKREAVPSSLMFPSTLGTPLVAFNEDEFPPLPGATVQQHRLSTISPMTMMQVNNRRMGLVTRSLPSSQSEPKLLIDCLDDIPAFMAANALQSQSEPLWEEKKHKKSFKKVKKPFKRQALEVFELPTSNSFAGLQVYYPQSQKASPFSDSSSGKRRRISSITEIANAAQNDYMPPTPYRLADALIDEHPLAPMPSRRLTQSQPVYYTKELSPRTTQTSSSNNSLIDAEAMQQDELNDLLCRWPEPVELEGSNKTSDSEAENLQASDAENNESSCCIQKPSYTNDVPEVITIPDSPEIITLEDTPLLLPTQLSAPAVSVCPYWWCEKLFNQPQMLQAHMTVSHREGTIKKCTCCEFSTTSVYFMRQHMIEDHAKYMKSLSLDPRIQNYDGSATSSPIPGYSPRYRIAEASSFSQPAVETPRAPILRSSFASTAAVTSEDLWQHAESDETVLRNVLQFEQQQELELWKDALSDSELLQIVEDLETRSVSQSTGQEQQLLESLKADFFFRHTPSSSPITPPANRLSQIVLVPDSQESCQVVPESPTVSQSGENDLSETKVPQSGGQVVNVSNDQWADESNAEGDAPISRRRLHVLANQVQLFQEGNFAVKIVESALGGIACTYTVIPSSVYNCEVAFLQEAKAAVLRVIRHSLQQHTAVKVQITMAATFVKADDESCKCATGFHTDTVKVFQANRDLPDILDDLFLQLVSKVDDFQDRGSNWILHHVDFLDIRVGSFVPIRGSCFIELPLALAKKRAVINVKNYDNECFKWAILSKLHPMKEHAYRVTKYFPFREELNFTDITFPVNLDDIKTFEKQNPNLSITVFGWKQGKPLRAPLYLTHNPNAPVFVNLLLLRDGNRMHYCWIKRLSAFFSNGKNKTYFCQKCFRMFRHEERLKKHELKCQEDSIETMPSEKLLEFRKYHRQYPVGCVIYADFEALQEKAEGCDDIQSSQRPFTSKQTQHEPSGFCLVTARRCCNRNAVFDPHEWYRGQGTVQIFLQRLLEIGEEHQKRVDNVRKANLTPDQWRKHNSATECYLCHLPFSKEKMDPMFKVLDHCHMCGKYRGTAHSSCNIKLYETRNVHVWFHNLRRYDGHFIFQQLGPIAVKQGLQVECVPKGTYDYITFSLKKRHNVRKRKTAKGKDSVISWKLSFRDSFAFMPCSLAKLVNNLKASGKEKFPAMATKFTNDELDLMLRKGVMPYEYIDCWERFQETKLPPRNEWYSRLNMEGISDEDYQHACCVWKEFGCKNLGDYHDLYMQTDVLLLADVFENFRSSCMVSYHADPAHYLTLPSYSWDSLLRNVKANGFELELLIDPEMYKFVEKGIRGGVSMISHRYSKANNPMTANYNKEKPTTWLMYLDANNLYGWAMSQMLPRGEFEWEGSNGWTAERILKLEEDDPQGYFFEVTLEVPQSVHDWHNMFPLAPESMLIVEDDLSPYARALAEKLKLKTRSSRKLVPNLRRKIQYVIHYRNLQFYLEHGLTLKEVHRVLKFSQAAWMKPYIDFNTEKRKAASNEFEKDNFKLMNNACFGKSMEDVRNRRDIRVATTPVQLEKLIAKPTYVCFHIISEDLVLVELKKGEVVLNKPIFTGLTVLDLSKLLMYQFHYDVMIRHYGIDKLKLLLTDTDSLLYEIETENVYEDFAKSQLVKHFDFSDYPVAHPLQSNVNKKVLGKMKDELNGVPIESVVALRPKMYSIVPVEGAEKNRAKGVKRALVIKKIRHDDYLKVLMGEETRYHTGFFLRPEQHRVHMIKENKKGLSCYDDKRFLLVDGIRSRPYGHYMNDYEIGYAVANSYRSELSNGSESLFESETERSVPDKSSELESFSNDSLYEDVNSSDGKTYKSADITYSLQELTVSQQNRRAAIEALSVSQFLEFIYL